MKTRLTRMTAMLAIAAATIALTSGPAAAVGPLQVGGASTPSTVAVTGAGLGALTFQTDYGFPGTCPTTAVAGEIHPGTTVTNNATIGTIHGWSSSCTATALNYPMILHKEPGTPSWDLVVDGTPSPGGIIRLKLVGVSMELRSAGAPPYPSQSRLAGTLTAAFDPSTQRLTFMAVSGVFPLRLTALNGRGGPTDVTHGGQLYTGDQVQLSSVLTIATGGLGPISH